MHRYRAGTLTGLLFLACLAFTGCPQKDAPTSNSSPTETTPGVTVSPRAKVDGPVPTHGPQPVSDGIATGNTATLSVEDYKKGIPLLSRLPMETTDAGDSRQYSWKNVSACGQRHWLRFYDYHKTGAIDCVLFFVVLPDVADSEDVKIDGLLLIYNVLKIAGNKDVSESEFLSSLKKQIQATALSNVGTSFNLERHYKAARLSATVERTKDGLTLLGTIDQLRLAEPTQEENTREVSGAGDVRTKRDTSRKDEFAAAMSASGITLPEWLTNCPDFRTFLDVYENTAPMKTDTASLKEYLTYIREKKARMLGEEDKMRAKLDSNGFFAEIIADLDKPDPRRYGEYGATTDETRRHVRGMAAGVIDRQLDEFWGEAVANAQMSQRKALPTNLDYWQRLGEQEQFEFQQADPPNFGYGYGRNCLSYSFRETCSVDKEERRGHGAGATIVINAKGAVISLTITLGESKSFDSNIFSYPANIQRPYYAAKLRERFTQLPRWLPNALGSVFPNHPESVQTILAKLKEIASSSDEQLAKMNKQTGRGSESLNTWESDALVVSDIRVRPYFLFSEAVLFLTPREAEAMDMSANTLEEAGNNILKRTRNFEERVK